LWLSCRRFLEAAEIFISINILTLCFLHIRKPSSISLPAALPLWEDKFTNAIPAKAIITASIPAAIDAVIIARTIMLMSG